MSHTDLGQIDLAALRAVAGDAEFAEQRPGADTSSAALIRWCRLPAT
jgi:hypothetical protein